MERTITVKGTGKVTCAPDLIRVSLTLKSLRRSYDAAMEDASKKLKSLQDALTAIDFAADSLKTTDFQVSTEYESGQDRNGNYRSVFVGYCCTHRLKIEFDFDTKLLSRVLAAVAGCISEPELHILFSVKDQNAVSEALLADAARNARAKAEVLSKASGVRLGELLSIRYDWAELDISSDTRYGMDAKCLCDCSIENMEIDPEDITVGDTATFVWEIC